MKRVANLLDTQQPNPPSVAEGEGVLRSIMAAPQESVDALVGHIPGAETEEKKMCSHYKSAVRAFLEFLEVCALNNVSYASLDYLFRSARSDTNFCWPCSHFGGIFPRHIQMGIKNDWQTRDVQRLRPRAAMSRIVNIGQFSIKKISSGIRRAARHPECDPGMSLRCCLT